MKTNIKKYTTLDPKEVNEIFNEYEVHFPREIRMNSLQKVMIPVLKNEYTTLVELEKSIGKSLSIKENNRLLRVTYSEKLSELQIEKEYEVLKQADLKEAYLVELWLAIADYLEANNGEHIVAKLDELEEHADLLETLCVDKYNRELDSCFRDEDECLDGIHFSEYRTFLYRSSNVKELRELGLKYQLVIPKYFTKSELQERLIAGLKEQDLLTPELEQEVMEMTSKKIKDALDNNNLDSRTYYTKEEVIEYILENNNQIKFFYEKPKGAENYGVDETVTEEVSEEPKEECQGDCNCKSNEVEETKEECQGDCNCKSSEVEETTEDCNCDLTIVEKEVEKIVYKNNWLLYFIIVVEAVVIGFLYFN